MRRVYWYENQYLTNGGAVSIMSDSVRKYKITDYAGSTRAEIIYNSKLGITTGISTFDYKPYGDTLDASTNFLPVQTFAGEERDVESSYMDMGYRTYDPLIGRFLQVDPLNETFPNITPYCYSYNSPMTWKDPSGLMAIPMWDTDRMAEIVSESQQESMEQVNFLVRAGKENLSNIINHLKYLWSIGGAGGGGGRVEARTGVNASSNGTSGRGDEFREYFDYTDAQERERGRLIGIGRELMKGKHSDQVFNLMFNYKGMDWGKSEMLKNSFFEIYSDEDGKELIAEILGFIQDRSCDIAWNNIKLEMVRMDQRTNFYDGNWYGLTTFKSFYSTNSSFYLRFADGFNYLGEMLSNTENKKLLIVDKKEPHYFYGLYIWSSNKFLINSGNVPTSITYHMLHEFGHMEHYMLFTPDQTFKLQTNYVGYIWNGDFYTELYADKVAYPIYQNILKWRKTR